MLDDRTALRTEARGIKDAAEVLSRVNDFVVNDMKKGMFVTLFYDIIDSKKRRLNYASAGHNPMILFRASLSGVVASVPITLMVMTSLLQIIIMAETGAIARVVALIKTVAPKDQVVQIMIVNVGFGTLLASLGATPVSILPPIMLALGYSSFVAIALPALGYDALCTYALLGVPVVVFSSLVGKPINEVGMYFAQYMPVVSTCIALGMLWIVGKWKLLWRGFLPAVLSGLSAGLVAIGMNVVGLIPLTGVAAGLGVVVVMLLYLTITRKPLYDRGVLNEADHAAEKRISLWAAISPWLILTAFAFVVNLPTLPFYDLVFVQWAMPVEIISGAPDKVRLFWQAYFWILASTILAVPFLKPTKKQVGDSLKKWLKRAPRPMLASAVFFAIAYIINHSGKGLDWTLADPNNNMMFVLANAAADTFGKLYPLAAPYLGLLAGFVSGSEASSIAMLTKLHLTTAEKIGVPVLLIAAASGIGGGLASVISPAKLQNAAAAIDRIGEESGVLRVTFVISLVITAVVAVMTLLWAFL
ncbi:MAG: SpoIIE family protein phosphatase [Anaerolineaceae bacterium]|nr:SpoIIE family protein phosphatase [Anaerolineaceae bacterium]